MGRAMAVLAICLGLAIDSQGPIQAAAVTDLDPDLKLDRSRRLGPFHVQPYFRIKQAGYDDNVYLEKDGQDGAFTATLGPGLKSVLLAGSRAAFMVAEELDYAYFADLPELNHFNNGLRAKLDVLVGPFLVYADARHDISRERLNSEIDFRVRHSVVGQVAGVKGQFGKRLTAAFQAGRQEFDFGSAAEEDLAGGDADRQAQLETLRELERVESEISASVAYRILRKTSIGIERSEGRAVFADPLSRRDARSRRLYLTASFAPSAFLTGSIRLGRLRLEPEERLDAGFDGPVGEADLGCRISVRGRARLRYGRNVVFSAQDDNLYFINEGWRAAYAHTLSDRWSMELERGDDRVDYPRPAAVGAALRRDRITVNALAGLLRVQAGTRIGLRLEQWNRGSTVERDSVRRYMLSSFVEYNY